MDGTAFLPRDSGVTSSVVIYCPQSHRQGPTASSKRPRARTTSGGCIVVDFRTSNKIGKAHPSSQPMVSHQDTIKITKTLAVHDAKGSSPTYELTKSLTINQDRAGARRQAPRRTTTSAPTPPQDIINASSLPPVDGRKTRSELRAWLSSRIASTNASTSRHRRTTRWSATPTHQVGTDSDTSCRRIRCI